jgi:putative peptidoglycan lipid II flippase
MFWSLPVVSLVVVLRAQIVRVLLGSGSFDWADTRLTAAALGLFVISLVGQSVLLLLVRAFYAGGQTRIPLLLTLGGTAIGSASAYLLYYWFMHSATFESFMAILFRLDTVSGVEVLMLPLGFTLGTLVQTVVMLVVMARTFQLSFDGMGRHFFVSICASLMGGAASYLTLIFVVDGVNQDRFVGILLQGTAAGVIGVIGVIVTYRLLRSPELHEISQSLHSRIFKKDVITPQPTELL